MLVLMKFSKGFVRLHNEFSSVHPIFHVSKSQKCIDNYESILPIEGLGVNDNLSYEKVPVRILDKQVLKYLNKEVASVKGVMEESLL